MEPSIQKFSLYRMYIPIKLIAQDTTPVPISNALGCNIVAY